MNAPDARRTTRVLPLLIALPTLLLVTACGGARTHELPRAEPGVRIAFADYSVLPPEGRNWRVAGRRDDAIVFGWRPSRTHSLVALASEKEASRPMTGQDDLVAYVRADWDASTWKKEARYQNRQTDLEADSRFGPYCVRYRLQSEDHGAVNRGEAPFLVQRSIGLICFHPKQPQRLVHISYTERSLPDEGDATFAKDADRYISGLRLADQP
ncbi:MAG TPA: hypothetical protein VKB51_14970 [bacterium]|nr:hypothetical protein [bacterium]